MYNIIQFYLPSGATLISPKGPNNSRGVRLVDLDGDGIQEIIALYRWRGKAYLMILKDDNKHWIKLAEVHGRGFDVEYFKLQDITKNGTIDIIIGWELGAKENELDIYTFRKNKVVRLVSGEKYDKFEIERLTEDKIGIVLWENTIAEAYNIEILTWDGRKFKIDSECYPKYFAKVVKYYKERLKELPRAAFYWYYLAEAQIRARMIEEAIESIEIGSSLSFGYPSTDDFSRLKEKAEIEL